MARVARRIIPDVVAPIEVAEVRNREDIVWRQTAPALIASSEIDQRPHPPQIGRQAHQVPFAGRAAIIVA